MGRLLYFSVVAVVFLFSHCEARMKLLSKDDSLLKTQNIKHLKVLDVAKSLNMLMDVSVKDSELQPYVSSPLTLQPYESLAPDSNSPPYCVYPPPSSQSPTSTIPAPIEYNPTPTLSTPPSLGGSSPSPPDFSSPPDLSNPPILGPPESTSSPPDISNPPILGPPESTPSPLTPLPNPPFYEPSPPSGSEPGPPEYTPSPIGFEPSPPVFEPPVVYPPPVMSPPPSTGGGHGAGVWCVAKPSVPDPIIQEAMNYACGSGADCDPIQSNGQCFHPNTILAHASYAFNSYWQRTKVAGGTCSFGGTAILVTVDPSSQGCRFVSY